MFEQVKALICQYVDIDPATITEDTNIRSDLGLNSLDLVNLVTEIEDEFDIEIPDRAIKLFKTVKDVVRFIEEADED